MVLRQAQYEREGGHSGPIRDCEVSEWSFSPCSQKCAMPGAAPGYKDGTRSQLLPPGPNGLPCPPLQARLPCGETPCPTDCEMGPWEEWGSCSTDCGGGTQSRTRAVVLEPAHGGSSCALGEQRRECGIGSCDVVPAAGLDRLVRMLARVQVQVRCSSWAAAPGAKRGSGPPGCRHLPRRARRLTFP
jgi:hypothetical protein